MTNKAKRDHATIDQALITIPAENLVRFEQAPFALNHRLSGHPQLNLLTLAQLARQLPRDHIEYNSGNLAPHQNPEDVPMLDLPAHEVVHRIEKASAWMVLKRVEVIPAYRQLLEEALGGVARARGFSSLKDADMSDIQGFIFVSSANAVTPFHFDAEDNFFVQIHGDKAFHIFNNEDRALVSEESYEISPAKHRNMPYREDFEERAQIFEMKAGDGMFVPYLWPHWVRTGSSYSISMAITWKTKKVIRNNLLLTANAMLRSIGFAQPKPGAYPIWDATKINALRGARAMLTPLRRSEALRRALRGIVFGKNANYFYQKKPA
jgi:hypothetical protein